MKFLPVLLILVITVFSFPIVPSYGVPTKRTTLHPFDQVVQVWFDALPQLTIMYPPAYSFNVAAKTSSGYWITSLHWDFGDGSTLDVPFSDQSQVSEIRTHQYTDQNNHCVSVTASDNAGNTGTTSVSLMPDFTLNAAPPSQAVKPGDSATYTVNVGLFCGRSVHVDLTTSNLNPSNGITRNLNPTSGNTPVTSTLLVQTATTTPKGTYTINIIGIGAGITHTVTVTLVVIEKFPYFTISVSPNPIGVTAQVRTNTTTVKIQSINGFTSPVNLISTGNPSGMNVSFSANPATPYSSPPYASQAIVTATCSVTPGTYAIQITGTSGNLSRQANLNVTVNECTNANGIWWWIVLGIISLLLMVPLIFILIRRRARVPPAVLVPPVILLPRVGYCMRCGYPMSFYEMYRRWYCSNCQSFV